MSAYYAWNDGLARHFFRPESAGRSVYLYVNDDVINEVGTAVGGTVEDFLLAVRQGPPDATRSGHCQRALQVASDWQARGRTLPPYLAYLALFVLAGGHEGDFAPQSYYPRLWELLDEPGTGTPPSFERMLELWDDLERWSVRDRGGDLGLFEARIIGGKIHVGLPLAQTVLTGAERRALPHVFAAAGLDAARLPSTPQLKRALSIHGRGFLLPRTLSALERGSEAFVSALVDIAADDFVEWDGSLPPLAGGAGVGGEVFSGLRICLAVDRVAGRLTSQLRCVARREFPERGLELDVSGGPLTECAEFSGGWSTPLADAGSGRAYEPPPRVWRSGVDAADHSVRWRARLAPAEVRAFVEGATFLLPGLVEVVELPPRGAFYLAFADAVAPQLERWLADDCDGWQEIHISDGLPPGWVFGSVRAARSDAAIRRVRPELGVADRLTMRLRGGIRAGVGNTYFAFAPPGVWLDGAQPGDRVLAAGVELEPDAATSLFVLPPGLPADTRIGLELWREDDVVRRSSLYLLSGVQWRSEPRVKLDGFGTRSEQGTICGALAPDPPPGRCLARDLLRTPGLGSSPSCIFFIGREPGQVSRWPDEPPPEWDAVWAIPFGTRGRAVFCGLSLEDAAPSRRSRASHKQLRLWHDVLWRRRRVITPPADQRLKALWRQYRDAARD